MSFSQQLRKFHKETIERANKVKRSASFDLFAAIIVETPVKKGVLRNNWFVQMQRPSSQVTDASDNGQGPIERTKTGLESSNLKDDIFFTNNLPYAVPIEFDGWSGKAPQGMVRINTLRWDALVRAAVRRHRNG